MSAKPITLVDALRVARQLEPTFNKVNLHLALTGSVLTKSISTKDIDFIVYRHDKTEMSEESMLAALEQVLIETKCVINNASTDYVKRNRKVFVTQLGNLRIDFLIP